MKNASELNYLTGGRDERFERNGKNGHIAMIVDRRTKKGHKYIAFEFIDWDAYAIREGLNIAIEKLEEALPTIGAPNDQPE